MFKWIFLYISLVFTSGCARYKAFNVFPFSIENLKKWIYLICETVTHRQLQWDEE